MPEAKPKEIFPSISRFFAEQKIRQALMAIGLTFADSSGLVVFDEEAETAFWRYDRRTGEEEIHVGPMIASLQVEEIEMVLRHEILHRSMYHGFGERYSQHQVKNLVLDVFINRLLFEAYREKMSKACAAIYPPESKKTLVALADCTAINSGLPPQLRDLWDSIWGNAAHELPRTLNPASLYYRLVRLSASYILAGNPFGDPEDGGKGEEPSYPGDPMIKAIGKVLGDLSDHLPGRPGDRELIRDYVVVPSGLATGSVEQFIERLHIRRIVDESVAKITEPLRTGVRIQPYPMFPTRLGLMYQILGISEVYSLYWNRDFAYQGSRIAIGLYVDVSGSMVEFFPLVSRIVDALKEYPLRLKVFDETLRDANIDELIDGRITGGGGTDFNKPVRDFVCDPELIAGVLFTDGEGNVDGPVASELRASRKKLYVIYVGKSECTRGAGSLDRYAADVISVKT